jgi:hypothetical protein
MAAEWTLAPAALAEGVAAVLADAITNPGTIEARAGGSEPWILQGAGPHESFWEVTAGPVPEARNVGGLEGYERLTAVVELFVPFSYEENTEATFSRLVKAARDAFMGYPTLGCQAGLEGISSLGHSVTDLRISGYSDVLRDRLVHYFRAEWNLERWFAYTETGSL